jgi:hypothetical protein
MPLSALVQGLPLLFAQVSAPTLAPDLRTLAQVSPRPALCTQSSQAAARWQRARGPHDVAFCQELARGYALLGSAPQLSLQSAIRAGQLLPNDANANVLAARAHVALGEYEQAWALFAPVPFDADGPLRSPDALHDYARAANLAGDGTHAQAAYRRLIARTDLMADEKRALSAGIEASLVFLSDGDTGRAEALSYLERAQGQSDSTEMPQALRAALMLVEQWAGKQQISVKDAMDLVPEALEVEITHGPKAHQLVLTTMEHDALKALALEHWDEEGAAEQWASVAQSAPAGSPWAIEAARRAKRMANH